MSLLQIVSHPSQLRVPKDPQRNRELDGAKCLEFTANLLHERLWNVLHCVCFEYVRAMTYFEISIALNPRPPPPSRAVLGILKFLHLASGSGGGVSNLPKNDKHWPGSSEKLCVTLDGAEVF